MTPHVDIDLGQHWLRWWLIAWRHQVIFRLNIDFTRDISAINQEYWLENHSFKISFKNSQGANESGKSKEMITNQWNVILPRYFKHNWWIPFKLRWITWITVSVRVSDIFYRHLGVDEDAEITICTMSDDNAVFRCQKGIVASHFPLPCYDPEAHFSS